MLFFAMAQRRKRKWRSREREHLIFCSLALGSTSPVGEPKRVAGQSTNLSTSTGCEIVQPTEGSTKSTIKKEKFKRGLIYLLSRASAVPFEPGIGLISRMIQRGRQIELCNCQRLRQKFRQAEKRNILFVRGF